MKINGIEIDITQDLHFNLDKLRYELEAKLGFWYYFEQALLSFEEKKGSPLGLIVTVLLFFRFIPDYIKDLFQNKRKASIIQKAEQELIQYYEGPEIKLKQFRLQCEVECKEYEDELKIIDKELAKHKKHLKLDSIGQSTKLELEALIQAFQINREKKASKYNFYKDSAARIAGIEEHLLVKKSIEESKHTLLKISDDQEELEKHKEDEKELELFDYYGNLLEDISNNLKKVEADKDGNLAPIELNEMLSVMKAKH